MKRYAISIHSRVGIPVEKDVGGIKHRYLSGIASGLKEDEHGEHVTPNCIESLCRQARSQDVLLFADVHGVKDSEDIGILTDFQVLPNGDWETTFRLYDSTDKTVDSSTLEKIDKMWAQLNGLPPYTKPRKKGFSIEGYIPDDQYLKAQKEKLGIIEDMILTGVVMVPHPAYKDSVIHAIYKSFDIVPSWQVEKNIEQRFEVVEKTAQGNLDDTRLALDAERDLMINEAIRKGLELEPIFDKYGQSMIHLIKKSGVAAAEVKNEDLNNPYSLTGNKRRGKLLRRAILKDIQSELQVLVERRKICVQK